MAWRPQCSLELCTDVIELTGWLSWLRVGTTIHCIPVTNTFFGCTDELCGCTRNCGETHPRPVMSRKRCCSRLSVHEQCRPSALSGRCGEHRRRQMSHCGVGREPADTARGLSQPWRRGSLDLPLSQSHKGANLLVPLLTSLHHLLCKPRTFLLDMSIHYGGVSRQSSHASQYGAPPPRPVSSQYGAPPPQGYYGHNAAPRYGAAPPAHGPPSGADPQLWQWFSAVDTDRSGAISVTELRAALVNGACYVPHPPHLGAC